MCHAWQGWGPHAIRIEDFPSCVCCWNPRLQVSSSPDTVHASQALGKRGSTVEIFKGTGVKLGTALSLLSLQASYKSWRTRPLRVTTLDIVPVASAYVGGLLEGRVNDSFVEMMDRAGSATFAVEVPALGNTIITGDPKVVQHFLKKNFENYVKGPDFHTRLEELCHEEALPR